MIAANELRYGVNVIGKGLNEGRVLTFNSLHRTDNTIAFFQNSELGEHLKDLDAIPLTEEWLLKFGLEKEGNSWSIKEFLIIEEKGEFFFLYEDNYAGPGRTELLAVHQIQNLHFALYGKDLEVKTPAPSQQLPG